jgi:hypothetical protein
LTVARKKGAVATAAARELALMRWRGQSVVDRRVFMEKVRRGKARPKEKAQEKSGTAEE